MADAEKSARVRLFKFRQVLTDRSLEVMSQRNAQYATEDRPISNYEAAGRAAGCSPSAHILGRMAEKMERMRLALGRPQGRETVLEEAREIINLSVLAAFANEETLAGSSAP